MTICAAPAGGTPERERGGGDLLLPMVPLKHSPALWTPLRITIGLLWGLLPINKTFLSQNDIFAKEQFFRPFCSTSQARPALEWAVDTRPLLPGGVTSGVTLGVPPRQR